MSLFANLNSSGQSSPFRARKAPDSMGYFAFSPSVVPETAKARQIAPPETTSPPAPAPSQEDPVDNLAERLRATRLAREREESLKGEEEWVRGGGILRDAAGRKDLARTNAIREELRLRDVEKALNEQWNGYEERWKTFVSSASANTLLRFEDIPWPIAIPALRPLTVDDFTTKAVDTFLTAPLSVRGCKVSRKERIRSSLLRWHPDKLSGILSRVVEEDHDVVKQAIGAVTRAIQELNAGVSHR